MVDFSETIAACDLKVSRFRQLFELMKVSEYSRSRSFLDLGLAFLRNHWAICNQMLYVSFKLQGNGIFLT